MTDPTGPWVTPNSGGGHTVDATDWSPSPGWVAGAMVSALGDLGVRARAVVTGTLLSPALQQERLTFLPAEDWGPQFRNGLSLIDFSGGWVGHDGSFAGYQGVAMHDPSNSSSVADPETSAEPDVVAADAEVAGVVPGSGPSVVVATEREVVGGGVASAVAHASGPG